MSKLIDFRFPPLKSARHINISTYSPSGVSFVKKNVQDLLLIKLEMW